MVTCPRCGGDSPDGSLHCVQCGLKLGEPEVQSTQFGMPVRRPGSASGPSTRQFGVEELASALAGRAPDESEQDETATPAPQSLMAGLPRPRVSSAPSPLTEGLKKPIRPKEAAQPSARSTVMGMPLYGLKGSSAPAEQPAEVEEDGEVLAPPRPQGASTIETLDSFGKPRPAGAASPVAVVRLPTAPAPEPAPEPAPVADPTLAQSAPVFVEPGASEATPAPQPVAVARPEARPAPEPAATAAPPETAPGGGRTVRLVAIVLSLALAGWLIYRSL